MPRQSLPLADVPDGCQSFAPEMAQGRRDGQTQTARVSDRVRNADSRAGAERLANSRKANDLRVMLMRTLHGNRYGTVDNQ